MAGLFSSLRHDGGRLPRCPGRLAAFGRITSIDQIWRVEPSRDRRGSHAASLDRLRIDHGDDGLIFIAVHDKAAFLDALAEHDDGLVRTPTGVSRDGR